MGTRAEEYTRSKNNECHTCAHQNPVPGNAHIRCSNPDKSMRGHPHGVANGWFYYPELFDPVWKAVECVNYDGPAAMGVPIDLTHWEG